MVFDRFWARDAPASQFADECGCYVFAVKTGRGLTPIYVGKAAKTFKQEAFNGTNKYKYHDGFSEYGRGKPVIFFVVHPGTRGRRNEKHIGAIEDFLIQTGVAKNPKLQNVRGAQTPEWSIQGVIRSRKGRRSGPEAAFRRLFDLTEE